MKKYLSLFTMMLTSLTMSAQHFLLVDFDNLDFNPITYNVYGEASVNERFKKLGVNEVTAYFHINGVGQLDPMPTRYGHYYVEKLTFFDKDQTYDIVSVKKGKYKDIFKYTLLYHTKYNYPSIANKALRGRFILYDFKTEKEVLKTLQEINKQTKYKTEVLNCPSLNGGKYIVVIVDNDVYEKGNENTVDERLKEIDNIKF